MLQKLKKTFREHAVNARGWRTGRKIVVIESDDWGAIRLPERKLLGKLKDWGIDVDGDHYLKNDALASEEDLERLFDTLRKTKTGSGSLPVITANTIMGNPDFKKIEAGRFEAFHFEHFTETLKSYPFHRNAFQLWKEGMAEELFHPQFHGREHLHVHRWMKGLKDHSSETSRLFNEKLFAVCGTASTEVRKSYMAAYEWDAAEDREFTLQSIRDGLKIFEETFGYKSSSAIAPNYTWNGEMEQAYAEGGVRYLQGGTVQRSPVIGKESNDLIRHHLGEKNSLGQTYLVRNCTFEPSADPGKDWVDSCLKEIKTSFTWRKPAIIASHRVNFIGYINPENRDRNLNLLDELLKQIIKNWPDVEFMTSDQLGALMDKAP
jgi:hypothetical protein